MLRGIARHGYFGVCQYKIYLTEAGVMREAGHVNISGGPGVDIYICPNLIYGISTVS